MVVTLATTVQVDVWFDLICPWCWIGKTHLDSARRQLAERLPGVQVQLRWHSVQLIPQTPPQGWPYQAFYEHRLGGPEAVRARRAHAARRCRLQRPAPVSRSTTNALPCSPTPGVPTACCPSPNSNTPNSTKPCWMLCLKPTLCKASTLATARFWHNWRKPMGLTAERPMPSMRHRFGPCRAGLRVCRCSFSTSVKPSRAHSLPRSCWRPCLPLRTFPESFPCPPRF